MADAASGVTRRARWTSTGPGPAAGKSDASVLADLSRDQHALMPALADQREDQREGARRESDDPQRG